jgi:hypothetical protein
MLDSEKLRWLLSLLFVCGDLSRRLAALLGLLLLLLWSPTSVLESSSSPPVRKALPLLVPFLTIDAVFTASDW